MKGLFVITFFALNGVTVFQIVLLVATIFILFRLLRYVFKLGKRISKKMIGGAVALGASIPIQAGTLIGSIFLW